MLLGDVFLVIRDEKVSSWINRILVVVKLSYMSLQTHIDAKNTEIRFKWEDMTIISSGWRFVNNVN
jgi:hypothetical protein